MTISPRLVEVFLFSLALILISLPGFYVDADVAVSVVAVVVMVVIFCAIYLARSRANLEQIAFSMLLAYYLVGFYIVTVVPQLSGSDPANLRAWLVLAKNGIICFPTALVICMYLKRGHYPGFYVVLWLVFLGIAVVSPVDNSKVKFQYLANSFIPLTLILLYFSLMQKSGGIRGVAMSGRINVFATIFILSVPVGIFISFYCIPLEYYSAQQALKGNEPINGYPRPWWTQIGGDFFIRLAGTAEDPILYGYIAAALCIGLYANGRKKISAIVFIAAMTSVSKGAIIWLLSALLIYRFASAFKSKNSLYVLSAISLMFLYLNAGDGTQTSASIHVLGLISPIQSAIENMGFSALFGNGIGSSGNILKAALLGDMSADDWLGGGAESGLGLVIYQVGLVGSIVLIICIFKAFSSFDSGISKSAWLVYWVNATLQENLINLNYLVCLFFVVMAAESAVASKKVFNKGQ